MRVKSRNSQFSSLIEGAALQVYDMRCPSFQTHEMVQRDGWREAKPATPVLMGICVADSAHPVGPAARGQRPIFSRRSNPSKAEKVTPHVVRERHCSLTQMTGEGHIGGGPEPSPA